MITTHEYRTLLGQLETLKERIDLIEANQRNAESGATACSAAGNPDGLLESLESQLKDVLQMLVFVPRNVHTTKVSDIEQMIMAMVMQIHFRQGQRGCGG